MFHRLAVQRAFAVLLRQRQAPEWSSHRVVASLVLVQVLVLVLVQVQVARVLEQEPEQVLALELFREELLWLGVRVFR